MLKELTKTDWLNILNLPESRIPAVLIVRGTRNFRSKYRAMLPYFDNVGVRSRACSGAWMWWLGN